MPITTANTTAAAPATSDTLAPYTMRLKTSRPLESVPMMCCTSLSAQPNRWMHGRSSTFSFFAGSSRISVGPYGAISGANTAIR